MNLLPHARTDGLIVQNVGAELFIYDLKIDKAWFLNETAAIVFNACDGKTTFNNLKRVHKFTDDLIFYTLDELRSDNLIQGESFSPFNNLTRRQVIRRIGFSTLLVLPVIASLNAPVAAQALSTCTANNINCSGGGKCCSGNCYSRNVTGAEQVCCASTTTGRGYPNGLRAACELTPGRLQQSSL